MRLFDITSVLLLSVWACLAGQSQTTTPAQAPGVSAPAQSPASAATLAPGAAPLTTFSNSSVRIHGVDLSGMVDGYYSFNNNHPLSGISQLYNFDDKTNQVDLNLLKLTASHDAAPLGFRVDAGYGRAMELMHIPTPDPQGFRYIEQAFISFKPKNWRGFEADFGDFVTYPGAEVIETKDNWNYSRSLLFSLAIPYYHFGVRTSFPIDGTVSIGFQIVDGWNAIVDPYGNNMKTVGITNTVTRKTFTWSNNYYVGSQYTGVNSVTRNLYDTTLLLTPNAKLNAYVNFDYGEQPHIAGSRDYWTGIAGAAHYQATKHVAFSPRAEFYDDATGFTTGTKQKLYEVTATGEYRVNDGLFGRLEVRHDGSNTPFYDHGNSIAASKGQTTITVGLIGVYPYKH